MTGGPLCELLISLGVLLCEQMTCFLLSRGGCTLLDSCMGFSWVCFFSQWESWSVFPLLAQVSPGCENLFHNEERALLLQQRIAQNRVSESGID